jgi:hypothetical protein
MTQSRKNSCKNKKKSLVNHKNAKKGTLLNCKHKTCKAIKYQSVYGSVKGGTTRSIRPLFY